MSIFSEGSESVGVSFGIDAMLTAGVADKNSKKLSLYIIPVKKNNFAHSHGIARILRKEGIICAIDILSKSPGKNLKYASQKGHTHALIIGDNEVSEERYTLRNLDTGVEQKVALSEMIRMFGIERL